ncbi:cupin domain-containing protein [Vibrio sp. T187]|nr:cupin domain-containing protein [Vibrio sp. T187]
MQIIIRFISEIYKGIKMVLVVNKEKLTEIKQAEVDGKIHDIGSFMPFNSSDLLKEKIGKQSPISFAFTKLTGSNTHNIHSHSTDSMVIVTKGSAKLIGDKEKNVCEGDVIFIPEGCKHGFSCEAGEEIECISIQFESESLFSEKNDINFLSNQLYRPVNSLYETNEQLAQDAENSKVFTMFKSGLMKDKKTYLYLKNTFTSGPLRFKLLCL